MVRLGGQAQLLQAGDRARGERLEREVGVRRTAPPAQRLGRDPPGLRRVTAAEQLARVGETAFEADGVDLAAVDLQHVARGAAEQHPRRRPRWAVRLEDAALVRHVRLD